MKTAEPRGSSTTRRSDSFFSKERSESFFSSRGPHPIQAKLNIGQPGDVYEKEADHAADQIVKHPNPVTERKATPPADIPKITPVRPSNDVINREADQESLKEKEKDDSAPEMLQKKPIFESRAEPPDDDKTVQRRADTGSSPTSAPAESSGGADGLESSLNSSKGSGTSLPQDTRSEMEHHFNTDLSGVRIHDDSHAADLSRKLNAQAFTYGNDIYFNSGKYNPGTSSGKHLLAHELTHTVQQTGSVQKMIQRKAKDAGSAGSIDYATSTITIPVINFPQAKQRADNSNLNPPLTYKKGYKRKESYKDVEGESSSEAQRKVWKKATENEVKKKVDEKAAAAKDKNAYDADLDAYYLKHKQKGDKLRLIGKPETMKESVVIPTWTKDGKTLAFDVDHVRELQLGGANFINNMELLHFSYNRAAGNAVKIEIDSKVSAFLEAEKSKTTDEEKRKQIPENSEKAKQKFDIVFETIKFDREPKAKGDDHYWSSKDISAGKQVDEFVPMTGPEIKKIKGKKGEELVYTSPSGGVGLSKSDILAFNSLGKGIKFEAPQWEDQTGKKPGDKVGSFKVSFSFYGSAEEKKSFDIPIFQMEGVMFGGHIPRRGQKGSGGLEQILVGLNFPGMSPVVIDQVDLLPKKGLQVRGRIQPTLKVIEGVEIDFWIDGGDFGISKTFSAGEIKVPKPFKINDASITLFAGTNGFGVKGEVLFEIEKLGKGKITGDAKTNGKFGIGGYFEFDKKLFSGGARVEVHYDNVDLWKVHGEIGIKEGTVKGIKSAKITVDYEKEVLEAKGTATVALKGVKEVTLRIKFEEEATEIEGGIKIEKLPGIKEGEGTLKVRKEGDEYDFSGSGKITPDIPGLTTQVDFEFHNDIFLVDAKVAFEKGRLKGTLNVGITNREIDPEGKPTGKALPDYKVYGNSELQLKLTDSITVVAGVRLLENGEIEVKGGIKLPPKIEVVPKLFSVEDKPIIEIPEISFPLFGIPLGVTTLGLEATIAPYIKASAQVGPGYLANTQAEVTYNPSHPEDLTVTGSADFEFIAEASIHAGVDFGVGISVGIAAATGGINLDAYLKVAAQQPIFHADIKYSPATGFELNGNVKAIVAAILGFSGKLFLKLRAGVWPLKKTWRWDKELFKKEIDTGLQIGFEFPFAYKNGQADVSFDKMKFVYPKFDRAFISNLSDRIVKPVVDSLL